MWIYEHDVPYFHCAGLAWAQMLLLACQVPGAVGTLALVGTFNPKLSEIRGTSMYKLVIRYDNKIQKSVQTYHEVSYTCPVYGRFVIKPQLASSSLGNHRVNRIDVITRLSGLITCRTITVRPHYLILRFFAILLR